MLIAFSFGKPAIAGVGCKIVNKSKVSVGPYESLTGSHLIDKIIVGVDNKTQLSEVISASKKRTLGVPKILNTTDEMLINPSLWDM